ncbi:alpha/beta hydrolase [Nocardia neocaledoniensis]|uniref:alpha/beta hydrolase n=1 Tax=Nocardia neocaledoniensis TaxID=236511 RepID=UPI0024584902|nr:alpha/beta hydrolase [Nocardia neocaledoniensis]
MSTRQTVFRKIIRHGLRPLLRPEVPLGVRRRATGALGVVRRLPRGTQVSRTTLGTRAAERIDPAGVSGTGAVLYLHGGGYTIAGPTTHRALAAHLAASAGRPVYVLDYRLAPEHPFPAALDDAVAAYHDLLAAGYTDITVAGDSAGGGLSLAVALRLREADAPAPDALLLISPWTDLTLSDPWLDGRVDDMLPLGWLRQCAAAYAPDPTDPLASPVYADLRDLPPVTVHVGAEEILRADAERLAEALRAAGVPVELTVFDGMWHVWHLHAGLFPEATAAVTALAAAVPRG